ncbi:prepilin-type N-terminal cleavage/methylation domain-containing protein [Paenibacillus tritici]|uniref:type II secretion system protein n=1 Tax=Paenibacillus tritici TaxID=1873425 RepID=UPI001BA92C95|nr:type II secretion system protein [Paenibacillus tritici]QUL54529.1 prepilin-type N-terminal cleavage/methylation domain-containing protein [Paenibacillus tritici]
MRKYVDRLRSQQGFTLIELIAAITLFSMIVGIISMVTMFGFRSYHKITIENSLRDEADLIMSSIINELYIFAPERVELTSSSDGILLKKRKSDTDLTQEVVKIAFTQGKLVIGAETDAPSNDSRTAVKSDLTGSFISSATPDGRFCTSASPCDSGLIEITLELAQAYDGRDYTMEMKSKFGF